MFDRRHLVASTRIAAVVGTVLFAINQLDVRDPGTGDTRDMGEGCRHLPRPVHGRQPRDPHRDPSPEAVSDPPDAFNARSGRSSHGEPIPVRGASMPT